jgi:hypothetical protein
MNANRSVNVFFASQQPGVDRRQVTQEIADKGRTEPRFAVMLADQVAIGAFMGDWRLLSEPHGRRSVPARHAAAIWLMSLPAATRARHSCSENALAPSAFNAHDASIPISAFTVHFTTGFTLPIRS